jgi:ABC-type cobalt transport system substrate-binding protein
MIAVNVSFLSIPGVMFSSTKGGTMESVHQEIILPSSSQIASTLSAEASIGSLVIGLFLASHYRTKQDLDPSSAVSG